MIIPKLKREGTWKHVGDILPVPNRKLTDLSRLRSCEQQFSSGMPGAVQVASLAHGAPGSSTSSGFAGLLASGSGFISNGIGVCVCMSVFLDPPSRQKVISPVCLDAMWVKALGIPEVPRPASISQLCRLLPFLWVRNLVFLFHLLPSPNRLAGPQ